MHGLVYIESVEVPAMSARQAATGIHPGRIFMNAVRAGFLVLPLVLSGMAETPTPVKVLKTNRQGPQPPDSEIAKTIRAHIDTEKYREVRVQLIRDPEGKPSHYLVYLLPKTSRRLEFARIALDQRFKVVSVERNYKPQEIDLKQQPGPVAPGKDD